jgi:hypothetical protein
MARFANRAEYEAWKSAPGGTAPPPPEPLFLALAAFVASRS